MSQENKIIATLRLTGRRFSGAGMAAGSASEITAVNDIINELIELFWWQHHPTRERLSKNFRATNELRFTHLVEGSVVIGLEPPSIDDDKVAALVEVEANNYLEQAVDVFEEFIRAVSEGKELPAAIYEIDPAPVRRLGSTLGNGEALQAQRGNWLHSEWGDCPRYTSAGRDDVLRQLKTTRKEKVYYQGLIRGTDLINKTFTFSDVSTGNKVKATYWGHPDFKMSVEGADETAAIWAKVAGTVEYSAEGGQHIFSDIESLSTEALTEPLKALYDELDSYLQLEEGWVDDDCGEEIDPSAVDNAQYVVFASAACNELPTAMSPTIEGGVNLSWIKGKINFSVELLPGGEASFHKANVSTGVYKAERFTKLPTNLQSQLHMWIKETALDDGR